MEAVGKLVRLSEERRGRLRDLPAEVFENIKPGLAAKMQGVLGVAQALAAMRVYGMRTAHGGRLEKQLQRWKANLGSYPEGVESQSPGRASAPWVKCRLRSGYPEGVSSSSSLVMGPR